MNKTKGFTLIELIIVVVLLGILSVTALPKFMNMTTQARKSAAQGIAGALGSAVNVAHSGWLVSGQGSTITVEGATTVVMSTTGYPECQACTASGTVTGPKCLEVWNAILQNPPVAATTTCTGNCQYLVNGASNTCTFQDLQGTGPNIISYNISTGAITGP